MCDADAIHLLRQDVIDALFEVRNLGRQPFVRRLVISRRNTPDFVNGSRNLTVLSAQRFAPLWSAAHASASVSQHPVRKLGRCEHLVVREVRDARQHVRVAPAQREARLRRSHGLLRHFAQGGQFTHCHRRIGLSRREDFVLAQMGKERTLRAESG